jgi:multicomponent K+:H+ antiporter subunit G
MSHAAGLPPLVALVVAIFALAGAVLALIGSIGLLRLKTFYERVHPPTMGTTLGIGLNLIASMILFTALESRPILHELLITIFMIVTTPVTFMLLVRAATHREHASEASARREQPADETRS